MKVFKVFIALILGTLVSIVIAEAFLANTNGLIDTPPGLFQSSSSRAFENRPHFKGRDIRGNPIRINSMGLRDGEYPLQKPSGVYRIFVLGDSVAFGDGVRAQDTFVKKLESLLNPNPSGLRVEVLNGGVRGYNTQQEALLLRERGFQYQPDLVVVAYVLNDAEPLERQGGLIGKKHVRLVQLKDFIKAHSYLYAFLRRNLELARHRVTPREFVQSYDDQFKPDHPGWIASRSALRELKDLTESLEVSLVVAVLPRLEGLGSGETYPAQDLQNQVLEAARSLGMDTLDLLPAFQGRDASNLKVNLSDTFHPNPLGHELIAEALQKHLLENYLSGERAR